jgi:hypothetical protein
MVQRTADANRPLGSGRRRHPVVFLLDTFRGFLFDGPLGPIPGGAFKGPVNSDPHPHWSNLEEVIELEIRPARPWSLSIWNVVVDGELYVPSASGAHRRWTAVAVKEPLVRVRTRARSTSAASRGSRTRRFVFASDRRWRSATASSLRKIPTRIPLGISI